LANKEKRAGWNNSSIFVCRKIAIGRGEEEKREEAAEAPAEFVHSVRRRKRIRTARRTASSGERRKKKKVRGGEKYAKRESISFNNNM